MDATYCKKCGAKNNSESKFCINCGEKLSNDSANIKADFTTIRSELTNTRINNEYLSKDQEDTSKAFDDKQMKTIGISIIAVVVIICLGFVIYSSNQNKLNKRSGQDTADMAQKLAEEDFGSDEVGVWYSKSDNAFTIKVVDGSDTDDTIEDNVDYSGSESDTEDFVDDYQTFIEDVKSKMGSNYSDDFTVKLVNPENSYRYLIDSTGTNIGDNYLVY